MWSSGRRTGCGDTLADFPVAGQPDVTVGDNVPAKSTAHYSVKVSARWLNDLLIQRLFVIIWGNTADLQHVVMLLTVVDRAASKSVVSS